MSIGLTAAVAILVLLALMGAGRGGARPNRRRKRQPAASKLTARGAHDDIDEYWGDALPPVSGSWDDPVPALQGRAQSEHARSKPEERLAPPAALTPVAPAEVAAGEQACELAVAFLRFFTAQRHMLPGMRGKAPSNVLDVAMEALARRAPTRTLPHGAVAYELDADHTVLFEPLTKPVRGVDKLLDANASWLAKGTLFLVLGEGSEDAPAELTAHIGPMVRRFAIAQTHFFLQEEDGSFHSHLEEELQCVPYRIEASLLPENFFEHVMGYCEERFSAGEPEATLRTLGPLAPPLWERAIGAQNFDPVLLASALNLLGAAHQATQGYEEAVASLESACSLLKHAEDYESVQIVEANLGLTLLKMGRDDPALLQRSTRHLQSAVRLAEDDVEAWRGLGDGFAARFSHERRSSLLTRAEHAYRQAQALKPSDRVTEQLTEVIRQRSIYRSSELPGVASSRVPVSNLSEQANVGADPAWSRGQKVR